MMSSVFLRVLDASFSGSVVILVILLLRLVLKKAPKSMLCLLWLLAGLRLMVPFEIESSFSLQPSYEPAAQIRWEQPEQEVYIPAETVEPVGIAPAATSPVVQQPVVQPAQEKKVDMTEAVPYVWLAGMIGMLLYTFLSYLRMQRKVCTAVRAADGCWETEQIDTAFVLGFLNPQIYLPTRLRPVTRAFIVSHERTHMDRYDHWWKLLGYLVVTVHWFNPLVWLAYGLLCRDMEMACDEQVVRHMDADQRKAYSSALLSCAGKHRAISACPVAFGEVSVKQRILQVLHYRKPGFWITLLALIALVFVLVCFMTSPAEREVLFNLDAEETYNVYIRNQYGRYYYFDDPEEEKQVIALLNGLRYDYVLPEIDLGMAGDSWALGYTVAGKECVYWIGDDFLDKREGWIYHFRNGELAPLMEYAEKATQDHAVDFRSRCYNSIQALKEMDSYWVAEQHQDNCVHTEGSHHSTHYYKSGDDWLKIVEYPDFTVRTMCVDGVEYRTVVDDETGEETWIINEDARGWVGPAMSEYLWNGTAIHEKDYGTAGQEQYVTYQVDVETEADGVTVPSHHLIFAFDLDWHPISVTQTMNWFADGRDESREVTTYFYTYDANFVQTEIDNHYLKALEDLGEDGTLIQKPLI